MDLSSSTTSTLIGLSTLISDLIAAYPRFLEPVSLDHLEAIGNARPPYLSPECSRALCNVKVGIVRAHFQFSQQKAVLCGGLPGDLIGVLVDGFRTTVGDVFAAINLSDAKTESAKTQMAVILIGTEIAVGKGLGE